MLRPADIDDDALPPGRDPCVPVLPIFRPAIGPEEVEAVVATLRSGWLGPGPRVAEFEGAFAAHAGAAHAISTNSGTGALLATLASLGVGPGDEVILPSFTFVSAFQVIAGLGATPVFADVDPERFLLDPEDVRRRITQATRGILAVHHGGQLLDLPRLAAVAGTAGLWLVDDAAHAVGARLGDRPVGGLCRATCYSFGAVKNLTTGDGGMVTTNDPVLAARIASFRSLGLSEDTWGRYGPGARPRRDRWMYDILGRGQRLHMNDLAASIGIVQLRRLHELNGRRAALVARYRAGLADIASWKAVEGREGTTPSWHMYTGVLDRRDEFIDRMRERNIAVGVHYYPIHLLPVAAPYRVALPVTESVWRRVCTMPMYPEMTGAEQERIIAAAREVLAGPGA